MAPPILIKHNEKNPKSFINIARHAMKQAVCNSRSILFEFNGNVSIVYPNDNPVYLARHLKVQHLTQRLKDLHKTF